MPDPKLRLDAEGRVILDDDDIPTAAERKAEAIANCTMCDPDGYHGSSVCDHIDHRAAANRGLALIREALAKTKNGRS